MKTFNIWGSFSVDVDFEIEAENEKEAERKAKEMIKDAYNLDAIGGLHIAQSATFSLLIDDEDENK